MKEAKEDPKRTQLAAHLGDTLRQARKSAELTQSDVAKRIGIATEVLGRIERGHMLPSLQNLRKLCHALHLDANVMLALRPENAPPWAEESETVRMARPEMRQLLRTLHLLDAAQLAVLNITANALLRHATPRPAEKPSK